MSRVRSLDILAPTRSVVYLFVIFSALSFAYALIYDKYNGDYLGVDVYLNPLLLFVNFIANVAPFGVLWLVFKRFKLREAARSSSMPPKSLMLFSVFLLFLNIVFTLLYGVGVASAPVYEAPTAIKLLIQISLRFNVSIFAYLSIFFARSRSSELMLCGLILLLSFLRSSLGVILFLLIIFSIKYHLPVRAFFRKRLMVTALAAVAFMFAAQSLYEIRDGLRGQEAEDISMPEFVLGRLVGRLSSFPNSAMIIEQAPFFFVSVASYRDEFPLVQALGGIVSGSLIPDDRPEVLLYQLNNQNDTEGVSSFMAGVNGIVYFSAYKSVGALFLALFLYLFFIYSTLWIAYNTKCKYMLEVTFVSLVYLGVSGVLNEFGYLFVSVLIASIFIKVIGIVNFSRPTSRRA